MELANMLNTTPLVLILVSLLCILLYRYFIYPTVFSPLSKIPSAHWSVSISPVWILYQRYRNHELLATIELHKRHGPIVRVAPSEISVSNYDGGIRAAYHGGFDKPQYYNFFDYYGQKNSFSSLDRPSHTFHRKRMSSAYSKSALFSSAQLSCVTRDILLSRFFPMLQGAAQSAKPVDILKVSYSLSLDLVNCFIFGLASGSDFLGESDAIQPWLEHYEHRYCKEGFWVSELPIFTRWLSAVGVNLLPRKHFESKRYLEAWVMNMCERADNILEGEKVDCQNEGDRPIVYEQVRLAIEKDSPGKNTHQMRVETASEMFDHLSGAREVLGLVLGYTIYYLSRSDSAQRRLREELLDSGAAISMKQGASAELPPASVLSNLPYLTAIVNESLRLRPNSTPLPRITPSNGLVSMEGYDKIPPGTRVNAFQWLVHRDEERWGSDVNDWRPERWLENVDGDSQHEGSCSEKAKRRVLWAFGSGPRMCIGSHLTQYLVRYILSLLVTNFDIRPERQETFGTHSPGSLDDRLWISMEPVEIE